MRKKTKVRGSNRTKRLRKKMLKHVIQLAVESIAELTRLYDKRVGLCELIYGKTHTPTVVQKHQIP